MATGGVIVLLAVAVVFSQGSDVTFVRCPNGSLCADRTTCCLQSSGQYGCCPYPFAVCCSDHQHCCPEGYRCNLSNSTCLRISTSVKEAETLLTPLTLSPQRSHKALRIETVRCPDGNYCQDGQTCCLLAAGQYGCCPYPNAVCCSDHTSCCPEGYRCKVSTQSCILGNSTLPMLRKVNAIPPTEVSAPRDGKAERVRCPDGNYCQDGQTCCMTSGGHFGCCPYRHAECCSDHASCCPEGYRCQVSTRSCVAGNSTVAMLKKLDTFSDTALEIPAPGNQEVCPDGSVCSEQQTCCQVMGGHYGCCPLPNAVCCDYTSCCPQRTMCITFLHACLGDDGMTPMVKKIPALRSAGKELRLASTADNKVQCPDGSSCLDQQTCCQGKNGSYGCCPAPEAVCCNDHKSCCPKGTVCVVPLQACLGSSGMTPMLEKLPALMSAERELHLASTADNKVQCPDGSSCLDQQTCCQGKNGSYGCCPAPEAVCCDDHKSCCPKGTVCVVPLQACLGDSGMTPMLEKLPALRSAERELHLPADHECPDGAHCDDDQTCCELTDHSYGCCPYNDAVCCDDLIHCCPEGYTCDTKQGSCIQSSNHSAVPLKMLSPRSSINSVEVIPTDHKCPDGAQCDDDQTCCELTDHSYGCCPYNDAVCCKDLIHCCPEGYTCDTAQGSCIQSSNHSAVPLKMLSPRSSINSVEVKLLDSTCQDGHICPGDTTCCPTPSGRYNCCPFASAVCCSDGEHCCPQSFQCDSSTQRCTRGPFYPFIEELPMLPNFSSSSNQP